VKARAQNTNYVKAKATKPEQSRTRPATVTARKPLEVNSSRMVHRLSRSPAGMEVLCQCTVKEFSFWRAVSRRVDALMQQCLIDSQAPRRRSLRLLPSTAPATRQAARLTNWGARFQARNCERPWTYATDGDQRKWLRNGGLSNRQQTTADDDIFPRM
jgi:hypothetical protein